MHPSVAVLCSAATLPARPHTRTQHARVHLMVRVQHGRKEHEEANEGGDDAVEERGAAEALAGVRVQQQEDDAAGQHGVHREVRNDLRAEDLNLYSGWMVHVV